MSDAERDEVLERLRTALGEGRLDADEFSERADTTLAARTFDDLRGVTADLPPGPSKPLAGTALVASRTPGRAVARPTAVGWPAFLTSSLGRWVWILVAAAVVLGLVLGLPHGPGPLPLVFLAFFLIRGGVGRGRGRRR